VLEHEAPRLRILVAEDHPVAQRVAAAVLEHLGFDVDVVGDGAEAVRCATVTPYHAVLMDCQLPLIDGYEATAAIRQLEGSQRHTPIIAVTASDDPSDLDHCLASGMDGYLVKPLRLSALTAALAQDAGDRSAWEERADLTEPVGPVLDTAIINRLARVGRAAGEDLVGQLTVLFLDDASVQVAAVRAALAAGDAATVARYAHTLRGASANLGATRLARLCATLVTNGTAGDLAGGATLLDAVETELGRVRGALADLAAAS
jgi:two-component system sensor histidine kinase/response regulator